MITGIPQKSPADNFGRVYCHYCQIPWFALLLLIIITILLLTAENVNLDEAAAET